LNYPTKIATCCFCGSKAALTLGEGRHELSCAKCGAPLHDLKSFAVKQPAKEARPVLRQFSEIKQKRVKQKRVKKKKSWLQKLAHEVVDAVEDVFD
tara:strand:- start:203 stop:490 length:288 start_codon:yes stop_codon:yes gene_type:complete